MIYRILADIILIIHFGFLLFTVFGGFLVIRWKRLWKIHLPTVIWGFLLQYFLWNCPLTGLEKYLRLQANETVYSGSFIEHYVTALLYPAISPNFHLFLGILLLASNFLIYSLLVIKPRLLKSNLLG